MGSGIEAFDKEGRVLIADYGDFVLFNIYFPNGRTSHERLKYKMEFYDAFLAFVDRVRGEGRSIVVCGDLNTAHKEIDLARPKGNERLSGFLPEERAWGRPVPGPRLRRHLQEVQHSAGAVYLLGPGDQGAGAQRRVEDRLLFRGRGLCRTGAFRGHPTGCDGLRPLPRRHRYRPGTNCDERRWSRRLHARAVSPAVSDTD